MDEGVLLTLAEHLKEAEDILLGYDKRKYLDAIRQIRNVRTYLMKPVEKKLEEIKRDEQP